MTQPEWGEWEYKTHCEHPEDHLSLWRMTWTEFSLASRLSEETSWSEWRCEDCQKFLGPSSTLA